MRANRVLIAAAVAALSVLVAATAASADTAVIPNDGSDPWGSGPMVQSPLEVVASDIASSIAGRQVEARCEGYSDWNALVAAQNVPSNERYGYVRFEWNGSEFAPGGIAELSPNACLGLQDFAAASDKPTKCDSARDVIVYTWRVVRKRIRVHGKWRSVRRRVKVAKTVEQDIKVPCGQEARLSPDQQYDEYALWTLAHESIHLAGHMDEAKADCWGLQHVADVAQALGDMADDGNAIALWLYTNWYPLRQTQAPEYWSEECKNNGALDINLSSDQFP